MSFIIRVREMKVLFDRESIRGFVQFYYFLNDKTVKFVLFMIAYNMQIPVISISIFLVLKFKMST